jgi:hypothetical protein
MISAVGRWSVDPRVLAFVAAAALPACDDGGPPTRGFDSRQLVQLRDPGFEFVESVGRVLIYSTGQDPAKTYWTVDIETGAVEDHGAVRPDSFAIGTAQASPPDPNARFVCEVGTSTTSSSAELTVVDRQTGARTAIGPIYRWVLICPTEADPRLTVWRRDDAGHITLWSGRYDDLQPVPLGIEIREVGQRTRDIYFALAGTPARPDALGLYWIDYRSFAVTELVPGANGTPAWAPGATPDGPLDSTTLDLASNLLYQMGPIGDQFAYNRVMSDGGITTFVGRFTGETPDELAVFRASEPEPIERVWLRPSGAPVGSPGVAAWRHHDASESSDRLLVWHGGARRLVSCPWPRQDLVAGATTPDGRHQLFSVQQSLFGGARGTLVLVSPELAGAGDGSAACAFLAPRIVSAADFSPDGASMFWLIQDADVDAELWLAASDGSAARLVATDVIAGGVNAPHFTGDSQLELQLDTDLVWFDVRDESPRTHPIAEHVFGTAIDVGRWLVTGYEHSGQDGNGRLGVFNRDSGQGLAISPNVAAYLSPEVPHYLNSNSVFRSDAGSLTSFRVVYLVRGRNPSSQDGLWVATINVSDLPQ